MNTNDEQIITWVRKCIQPIGPISVREIMNGHAIYLEGIQFAYVENGRLWIKSDDESDLVFDAAGSDWLKSTRKDGTTVYESYREAPEEALKDPKDLRKWAKQGLATGKRGKL